MDNKLPQRKHSKLIKIGEAAKALGVSLDTLRRWEKSGKIPSHRTSAGTRLYSLSELNKSFVINQKKSKNTPIDSASKTFQPVIESKNEVLYRKDLPENSGLISQLLNAETSITESPAIIKGNFPVFTNRFHIIKTLVFTQIITVISVLILFTLLFSLSLTTGYLFKPEQTYEFASKYSTITRPFDKIALGLIETTMPDKARVIRQKFPPPNLLAENNNLSKSRTSEISLGLDRDADLLDGQVLAATTSGQYLQINSPTDIVGPLTANTLDTGFGANELYPMDQPVLTTSTVTFGGLNIPTLSLTGTSNQLTLANTIISTQSGGSGPFTVSIPTISSNANFVLDTATQTLTNKTISGSSNTLSNIPNSALSNSAVTISAGSGLSGGGTVSLGGSITLSAEATGVTSITGTSNQVIASSSTGAVTLSLPQNIATSSTPSFAGVGLNGSSSGTTTLNAAAATTSYTLTLPSTAGTNGYFLSTDGSGNTSWIAGSGGTITGSGTTNTITKFTGATAIGNSLLTDDGTTFAINTDKFTINESTGNTLIAGTLQTGAITAPTSTNTINGLVINSGTITTGTWNGTAIGTQYGGTGQNFSATAQGSIPYFNGTGTMAALAPSTSGYVLSTQGAGANPIWTDAGTLGVKWNNIASPDGNQTLAMANYTTTWNWATADDETAFTATGNALTTGILASFTSSAAANFTGSLANISLTDATGASSNTGILLNLTNSGTANANTAFYIKHYATGTGNLAMRVDDVSGDTTPFVIDGAGNVGIGTTAPVRLLHLNDTTSATAQLRISSTNAPAFELDPPGSADDYRFATHYLGSGDDFAIVDLSTGGNGTGRLAITNGNVGIGGTVNVSGGAISAANLTVLTGGNVGIGDVTPSSRLEVGDGTDSFQVSSVGDITFVDANDGASITGPAGGALLVTASATNLNLQSDGSIDVNIAGGSGATGCTVTNSSGALACTGNITGGSTGTVGYWSRSGTTLSPATANDIVSISNTTTTGADLAVTNTGVYTGTGIIALTANSATTGDLLTLSGTALTSGTLLTLTGPSGATAGLTDAGLKITSDINNIGPTNGLVNITGTIDTSTFSAAANNVYISTTNSNSSSSNTAASFVNAMTDSTSLANLIYGYKGTLTLSGNGNKTSYASHLRTTDTSTAPNSVFSLYADQSLSGAISTGTRTQYGIYSAPANTAANTGGTTNIYGGYFTPSYTAGGDSSSSTENIYGNYITTTGTLNTGGTINQYGLYVDNGTSSTTGTSAKYGVYINTQSGADTNYALYSAATATSYFAGNVGIGTTAPSTMLQIGTAGTSTGTIGLTGATSGMVTITPAAAAGTWTFTLPTTGGTNGYVLTTNGSGTTTWTDAGTLGVKWNNIASPDGNQTLAMANYTTTWNWATADDENAFTATGNALTSGSLFNLSSSSTGLTGNLVNLTQSGSNASNTGSVLSLTNSGTANTNTSFYLKHYATGTGNLAMRVDDVSGDTSPFVIDGTGNVGIGLTNPSAALHVGDGLNLLAGQTTGKIGFGGAVSGEADLVKITLDSTQDWQRAIHITQENDSSGSEILSIENTSAFGSFVGSLETFNIESNLIPGATTLSTSSDINLYNSYLVNNIQNITLSSGNNIINSNGQYVTLLSSPTFNSSDGSDDISAYGVNSDVSGTPVLTAVTSGSVYSSFAGNFINTASTGGNANLTATAYGIQAKATGNLTTTGTTAHYGGYFQGSGTADNNYGVYVNSAADATNNYGLYINTVASGSTNYSIFNNAAAQSYLGSGNVGIGTSTPTSFMLEIAGSIGPSANDTYNLGSDGRRFADLFLGGETLHIGNSTSDEAVLSYTTSSNTLLLDNVASGIINLGTGSNAQTITTGNATGATALNFTSGTGSQTHTSSVATGTTTSGAFVFNASSLSTGTALYLTSTATSGKTLDINATQTSGTIFNLAYGASKTLAGDLTGLLIDLNSGNVDATNQNLTGVNFKIPTVTDTHTTGTKTLTGMLVNFGSGAGINQNGAGGTLEFIAGDFHLPALTETAGTLNAYGTKVTTPATITTGGTAYGNYISATGVGAGNLNGVGISSITGGAGTEYALNIGSGWDAVLRVGSTTIINGSGVTQVAGGGTGQSTYTTGDILYASNSTTLTKLPIGNSDEVLTVSAGIPAWTVISGSSCTNCLINNPTVDQYIAPTGQSSTGLTVRQTSTASPTDDIFQVTDSTGSTKYFYVDKDGNVSTGAISNTTLTLTPTTNTTALTLVGTNVTSAKNQYINTKNSSGTISDISYGAAQTLAGTIIGHNIDLSTNVTATNQSETGLAITLAGATNTSGTQNYKGISISGGSINENGGTATTFTGADITIPALTQTSGTLTAYGANITTPSSITTGGTATGININASGVGAGTLTGVNIGSITAGAGTENGLTIGSGWDTNLYFNDTTTNVALANGGSITIKDDAGNSLCTITDSGSSGDLSCTGTISGAGTVGFWQRVSTTLSPVNAGDNVTTSGNISTTSTGTITSAGLLTGSLGATISGATTSINASSNFATNINTGTSNGAVSIGNSVAGALSLASGAASSFTVTNANLTLSTTGASGTNGRILLNSALASGNTTTEAFSIKTTTDLAAADEVLQIGDSAADFLTILGNGNVGIGTTAPTNAKLEIGTGAIFGTNTGTYSLGLDSGRNLELKGSGAASYIDLANATSDDYDWKLTQVNTTNFKIHSSATDNILYLQSDGNVGIGTAAPISLLSVSQTRTAVASYDMAAFAVTQTADLTGSGALTALSSIGTYSATGTTNDVLYGIQIGAKYAPASAGSASLRGLYVFNGATTANATVTTNYSIDVATPTNSGVITDNTGIYIEAQTSATNNIGITIAEATGTKNTNLLIGTTSQPTGSFSIYNASTDFNYFGGNVGIGVTANGTGTTFNVTGAYTDMTAGGGTGAIQRIYSNTTAAIDKGGTLSFGGLTGNAVASYDFAGFKGAKQTAAADADYKGYLAMYTSSAAGSFVERLRIDGTGNVGIGMSPAAQLDLSTDSARKLTTTTWATGSDARFKTNIETISDALDIIDRVRPVKFHYNSEFLSQHPSVTDTDYYNFIAQEYQQVFPDSVSEIDGRLYVNSSHMIPYAIAGIKELNQKVENALLTLDKDGNPTNEVTMDQIVITSQARVYGKMKANEYMIDQSNINRVGTLASIPVNNENQIAVSSVLNGLNDEQIVMNQRIEAAQTQVLGLEAENASQTDQINQTNSQILSQAEQLASAAAELADAKNNINSLTNDVNDLKLTPPSVLGATESATFANIDVSEKVSTLNLSAIDATISGTFKALGNAILPSTTIAGDLTVDGTLSITSGNTLDVIGTLFLQKNVLAENLDIFNGKVTIDKSGRISTDSLALGDQSVGEGTILEGETEITIPSSIVKANSKIFITPTTDINGSIRVGDINPDHEFKVRLNTPNASDVKFNWLIVQVK